jgi:peptide deformylase
VQGFDRLGRQVRMKARGLLARCFQHEFDHLDGMLYVDRLAKGEARKILLQAP